MATQAKLENIDKKVPPEVWERIFKRLYPSQLCRLSLVNKTFYKIIISLSVWSDMFFIVFGSSKRLRLLPNRPESMSYMLWMCSCSHYICEMCYQKFLSNRQTPIQNKLRLALAPMPTLSKGNIQYLGEEINETWKIMLCLTCRRRVETAELSANYTNNARILWYRRQRSYSYD